MEPVGYKQFWVILTQLTRSGETAYQGIYMDLETARWDFLNDMNEGAGGRSGMLCGPFDLADGVSVDPRTCKGRVIDSYDNDRV